MTALVPEPNLTLVTLLNSVLPEPAADDEQVLSRAAASGDHAAFAELVRRAQGAVFGLCFRLTGDRDAAADAAQEAFVRAYAALGSFDPAQRFDVWVLRIARNHCFDLLRRRGKSPAAPAAAEDAVAAAVDHAPSALERLEEAELTLHLESALEALAPTDREVLALYYVQGRRTRDIAEVQGVAPGTIMARLFRAREKLRAAMSEVLR